MNQWITPVIFLVVATGLFWFAYTMRRSQDSTWIWMLLLIPGAVATFYGLRKLPF